MITPKYLSKGDKIGIVATARKIELNELSLASQTFGDWGLEVVYGNHLFKECNQRIWNR